MRRLRVRSSRTQPCGAGNRAAATTVGLPVRRRRRTSVFDDAYRSRSARFLGALMELARILYEPLVRAALLDDFGVAGDVTSEATIPPGTRATASLVARKPGVLAGLDAALYAFELLDPNVIFERFVADGEPLEAGTRIATLSGDARGILGAERTALNLLSHASGIATATARYVSAIPAGTTCRIIETRKTLPGLRALEKYAVRRGRWCQSPASPRRCDPHQGQSHRDRRRHCGRARCGRRARWSFDESRDRSRFARATR